MRFCTPDKIEYAFILIATFVFVGCRSAGESCGPNLRPCCKDHTCSYHGLDTGNGSDYCIESSNKSGTLIAII